MAPLPHANVESNRANANMTFTISKIFVRNTSFSSILSLSRFTVQCAVLSCYPIAAGSKDVMGIIAGIDYATLTLLIFSLSDSYIFLHEPRKHVTCAIGTDQNSKSAKSVIPAKSLE